MPPLPPLDGVLVGQVGGHGEREEGGRKKGKARDRETTELPLVGLIF